MGSDLGFVPVIKSNALCDLTDSDLAGLRDRDFFLVEQDTDFVLIDVNREFEPNDIFLGSVIDNKIEFFQFIRELEGEWKIKIKALENGKTKTVSLDKFKIYGVAIDLKYN